MLELSLFHFILGRFRPAEGFVRFCSKNVNTIYLIQWVIIGIWVGFGGCGFGFRGSVFWGFIIAFASIGITKLLPPFNLSRPGDKNAAEAALTEQNAAESETGQFQ